MQHFVIPKEFCQKGRQKEQGKVSRVLEKDGNTGGNLEWAVSILHIHCYIGYHWSKGREPLTYNHKILTSFYMFVRTCACVRVRIHKSKKLSVHARTGTVASRCEPACENAYNWSARE